MAWKIHFTLSALLILCGACFAGKKAGNTVKKQSPAPVEIISPQPQEILLLPARPVDLGPDREYKKNLWMIALLDANLHFRFDHLTSLHTVYNVFPQVLDKKNKGGDAPDYSSAIRDLKPTHIAYQKFQINNPQKTIRWYLQIVNLNKGQAEVSIETHSSIEDAGRVMESCFALAVSRLAAENPPAETIRFFSIPSLFTDYKSTMLLGKLLLEERYSGNAAPDRFSDKYAVLCTGEKQPLLLTLLYGEACLRDHFFDQAISQYRVLLPLMPESGSCGLAIAQALLGKGDVGTAKYRLSLLVSNGMKPVPLAYSTLGDAYLAEKDTAAALSYYEKERTLYGSCAAIQDKVASICLAQRKLPAAEFEYKKLIGVDSAHALARYYLAIIALDRGAPAEADTYCVAAERHGSGTIRLWEQIGDRYAGASLPLRAVYAYEKAFALDKNNFASLLRKLSSASVAAGRDSAAAEYLIQLFERNRPANAEYLAQAGHLFAKLGLTSKAAKAFGRFLDGKHTDDEVNTTYARIKHAEKNWIGVIRLLQPDTRQMPAGEESLFMLAEAYRGVRNWKTAGRILTKLYAMNPKNPRIVLLSAETDEQNGELAQAAQKYEVYLGFPAAEKKEQYALHAGELYEKIKRDSDAARRYEENLRLFPEDRRNYDRLAGLYLRAKEWAKLKRTIETAMNAFTVPPAFHKMLAQSCAALHEKIRAVKLYQTYCASEKKDIEARRALGELLFDMENYAAAIDPLKRAASGLGRDFKCHYMLGYATMQQGDLQTAAGEFDRAHAINPEDITTITLLAECRRSLKQPDKLIAVLQKWIAIDSSQADIRIELGTLYWGKNRTGEAQKVLNDAIRISPSDPRPHRILAGIYKTRGVDDMELYHLKAAAYSSRSDAESILELADYYKNKDNIADAKLFYKKAIEADPSCNRAFFEYGAIAIDQGDTSAGYAAIARAASSEPKNALYAALLSRAAALMEDERQAVAAAEKAIRAAPNDPLVLFWCGCAFRALKRGARAEELFSRALACNPALVPCCLALGDLHFENRRFNEALALYRTAREHCSHSSEAKFRIGKTLWYTGRPAEASVVLQSLLAENPAHDEARFLAVTCLCDRSNAQKAREIANFFNGRKSIWRQLARARLLEEDRNLTAARAAYARIDGVSSGDPFAEEGLGRVCFVQEEYDSAVSCFSHALAGNPGNPTVLMKTGEAYTLLGKDDSAYSCYAEVDRICPEYFGLQEKLGFLASKGGHSETAVRIFKRGLRYHPNDGRLLFMLGREYERSENYADAIQSYTASFKAAKKPQIDALLQIGNIYHYKLCREGKAKKYFSNYVKSGGKNQQALVILNDQKQE